MGVADETMDVPGAVTATGRSISLSNLDGWDIIRTGLLVAFVSLLIMWFEAGVIFTGWLAPCGAFVTLVGGLFAAQMARMWQIWRPLKAALIRQSKGRRAPADKAPLGRGFSELFVWLFLNLTVMTGLLFFAEASGLEQLAQLALLAPEDGSGNASTVQITVFLAILAISFVPLLTAFALQGANEAKQRNVAMLRDDVVTPLSLGISAIAIGGIILLAWAAGGEMFQMSDNFGVYITLIVITGFLVFIIAPHIARYINDQNEALAPRPAIRQSGAVLPSPVIMFSWLDSLLVRLVAPLSGATQSGAGLSHVLFLILILLLSAIGFALASPFGLLPIALAMLIILALGRRWAWVEEDRETASRLQSTRGHDIHIGFGNDLKDEALLGYAALFVLVPMALYQIQGTAHAFTTDPSQANTFVDWVRFFGAELAKAVPFVDWWEIYNVTVSTPFDATESGPMAKHLTFAARAMVDLVIMAALFQALGIWQRSRTQQKLYDSGQLNSFDPFTEIAFFERGMSSHRSHDGPVPKRSFEKRVGDHVTERRALQLPGLPYSQRRLSELILHDNKDVRAGARWMVGAYGVLAGDPVTQLAQLRGRWTSISFPQAPRDVLLREKLEFERILNELLTAKELDKSEPFGTEQTGTLIGMLEAVKDCPEFSYGQLLAIQLIGRLHTKTAVKALATHVLGPGKESVNHYEQRPEWRQFMESAFGLPWPKLYLGLAPMRMKAYAALSVIGENWSASLTAREFALEVLEWMAEADRSDVARNYAAAMAATVRVALGYHETAPDPD